MTTKTLRILTAFILIAIAQCVPLSAQVIGGRRALNSRTWAFESQQQALPTTTLFTSTCESDFLITVYLSSNVNQTQGGSMSPTLNWTDEFGSQQYMTPVANHGGPSGGSVSFPIHVVAGTSVTVSVFYAGSPGGEPATYSLRVGKIKINP